MNYNEALNWIHGRLRLGIKPGLKRMEWMMEKMNHPERRVKFVHIGGTNGKGSTVTFVRSILQSAGYEVGTFTSPYIEQFNERISVNGIPISNEEIVLLTQKIIPLANELGQTELGSPTEFEVITAMCLYYFAFVHPVNVVVMEVGLGGRFDSTNIIHPLVSVITNIGLDHINILGETIADIAFEKAGIIKAGTPVIVGEQKVEALHEIEKVALIKRAKVYKLGEQFTIKQYEPKETGEQYTLFTPFDRYPDLLTSLKGYHQTANSALAIMAVEYLKNYYAFQIDTENIYEGVRNAYWPGRFESLMDRPLIIVDGAHNREGIETLTKTLTDRYKEKKIKILFAGLADKPVKPMLEQLSSVATSLYVTSFDFPRAAKISELIELLPNGKSEAVNDWKEWMDQRIQVMNEEEILVITGSLYFISEVKSYFQVLLLEMKEICDKSEEF